VSEFSNEPLLELRRGEVRERASAALAELDSQLPIKVPLALGEKAADGPAFDSVDPSAPDRIVASARAATREHVSEAVGLAEWAQPDWAGIGAHSRAELLRGAAELLHERRLSLAALAVREAGKPWVEADADVAEAIDYLRFYAAGAERLAEGHPLIDPPGESNSLLYTPRGVTAVIAPWNFPFAILCGMTAAALAVGNAVVVKPAEQTPACGREVVAALHEAGVPANALILLPGGDEPGRALVSDPRVSTIAFTGSSAAGLDILRNAAAVSPGQRQLKRVIAEMGGRNSIIVDADADLDEVVPGVIKSAFGFAGQKCSAAQRLLVHAEVGDELLARLEGARATLRVGPAEDFAIDVPPVIDAEARDRITQLVAASAPGAAATYSSDDVPDRGYYVAPTILVGPDPESPALLEEVFGPVLTVEAVASVDEACDVVKDSRFALTGGLYTRNPATVRDAVARLPVGNLYVNREITGARVGRQPFGGGRLSGTGPKAGGPDYLLHFVEARCVTENTVRHGVLV
jgi:RHH-type transcriptional regulator, proline utilization regulon repressor / proline dehydrogenase / delta 1-pyrroline-5-carboxylate dehydrogenase